MSRSYGNQVVSDESHDVLKCGSSVVMSSATPTRRSPPVFGRSVLALVGVDIGAAAAVATEVDRGTAVLVDAVVVAAALVDCGAADAVGTCVGAGAGLLQAASKAAAPVTRKPSTVLRLTLAPTCCPNPATCMAFHPSVFGTDGIQYYGLVSSRGWEFLERPCRGRGSYHISCLRSSNQCATISPLIGTSTTSGRSRRTRHRQRHRAGMRIAHWQCGADTH